MKVNTKRLTLWLLVLIIWCGVFTVAGYAIGQHYGKNVAPQQFESDTTAYKELRTQRAVENGVNLVGIAGGIFFLFMAGKQFKLTKEEK